MEFPGRKPVTPHALGVSHVTSIRVARRHVVYHRTPTGGQDQIVTVT
jgi:hypothetical protein